MHIYDFLQEWLDNNFRKDERLNFYIFLSENILTPEALRSVCIKVVPKCLYQIIQMYRVHQMVHGINANGKSFTDICER